MGTNSNSSSGADISSFSSLLYSYIGGLGAFILFSPFYRSRKSWWDALAARQVIYILRVLISIEIFLCLPLLYCAIDLGYPVSYPLSSYALPYGTKSATSWIFGYGRPCTGIVTIGIGLFGELHPGPRIVCVIGSLFQTIMDSFSIVAVDAYAVQVKQFSAPQGLYNTQLLGYYSYRDVVSIIINIWICLLCSHLSNTVGWTHPPYISYMSIVGGDVNRCDVMRRQRLTRNHHKQKISREVLSARDQESQNLLSSVADNALRVEEDNRAILDLPGGGRGRESGVTPAASTSGLTVTDEHD